MKWSTRRATAKAGVLAIAAGLALSLFGMSAAYGAGSRAGDATITDPSHAGAPLASGSQGTTFSIALPAAAACSGTAAGNPSYHVYGFIIPAASDPLAMTFDPVNGPSSPALPLFDTSGTQYGPANPATSPPGQVINIPSFNWSKFTSTDIPAGNYRVGIACAVSSTNPASMDKYWDVPMTFDASLNWQATNPTASVPESPLNVALPLSAVVLLGGAGVIVFRRRSRHGSVAA